LALGFRPFYLVAASFAVLALPYWIFSYIDPVPWGSYLRGISWHSHEMIFGFAAAVIAGFLLTAVRNWTGLPTPTGKPLGLLVGLWVLARLTALSGPAIVAVALDALFVPVLGAIIALPIWRSRNARNYKILAVLAAYSLSNIVYHLSYLSVLPVELMAPALAVALDVLTILMAVIGGRVIPAFTANAVVLAQPRHVKSVEVAAMGSLLLILVADAAAGSFSLPPVIWIVLLALAAFLHALRLWLWQPQKTIHNPLLSMLPAAYLWIPISLALRAGVHLLDVPPAAATHALTIGAISSLMMAMMTRSALGHTGRTLSAGWAESTAFLLLQLAAVMRLVSVMAPMRFYREAVIVSGICWSLAFAVFLLRYWTILTRPRIDGRPG
jgi:uncharacterized protein involved in response to NO